MYTHFNVSDTPCYTVLLLYIPYHLENLILTGNKIIMEACPHVGGWCLNLDMQNITIIAVLPKKEGCTAAELPLFESLKYCHACNLQNDSLLLRVIKCNCSFTVSLILSSIHFEGKTLP